MKHVDLLFKLAFLSLFLLLSLLLFRNPFSVRTLIPNFEPYPDSLHYITSARCFLAGQGFSLCREGRQLETSVPPLYAMSLIPFFLIRNDPRMFYFANVLFTLISVGLFFVILRRLKIHRIIQFATVFFYVTHQYVYWFPTLAMAENLLIPTMLLVVYLFLAPLSKKNAIFSAFAMIALYEIKYVTFPLVGLFGALYGLRILLEQKGRDRIKIFGLFVCFFVIIFMLFDQGKSIRAIFEIAKSSQFVQSVESTSGSGYFSTAYIPKHFPLYLRSIFGKQGLALLWRAEPFIYAPLGFMIFAGLVLALFKKEHRRASIYILGAVFSQVLFLSSFYAPDSRYILQLLPVLYIGLAIGFQVMWENQHRMVRYCGYALLSLVLVWYLISSATRLRFAIALNLKYAETPWYYLSVQKLNEVIDPIAKKSEKQPVVISALVPYFVDFYSSKSYRLLPLSPHQEFPYAKTEVWGDRDYSDFKQMYQAELDAGVPVYVSNYGLGNVPQLHQSFQELNSWFLLTKIADGCYDLCNVYQVTEKQ
ncbi:MAG TPA: hypothetical protein DCW55_03185 [Candidatus Pacebacteria bacterium]|nr:MAG: hypothetical protein A2378_02125 [Candidatus Pacebacteria bacterium RIFOXYB1_FULL_44_10]HAU99209.1 hypothetical protein [Candidatus Paceibacterota bacterium]HAX01740.1 hypothetical protein [Candidatus Paceibacterota bacterium]